MNQAPNGHWTSQKKRVRLHTRIGLELLWSTWKTDSPYLCHLIRIPVTKGVRVKRGITPSRCFNGDQWHWSINGALLRGFEGFQWGFDGLLAHKFIDLVRSEKVVPNLLFLFLFEDHFHKSFEKFMRRPGFRAQQRNERSSF